MVERTVLHHEPDDMLDSRSVGRRKTEADVGKRSRSSQLFERPGRRDRRGSRQEEPAPRIRPRHAGRHGRIRLTSTALTRRSCTIDGHGSSQAKTASTYGSPATPGPEPAVSG